MFSTFWIKRLTMFRIAIVGIAIIHSSQPCYAAMWLLSSSSSSPSTKRQQQPQQYDLVVIGAGASGLFASGTAASLGLKTLLLDKADGYVGGDCSNAACIPSKSIRSVARLAHLHRVGADAIDNRDRHLTMHATKDGNKWLTLARAHATKTVIEVRRREDVDAIKNRNPNLDLEFVQQCKFISANELELVLRNETNPRLVKSKSFLIATGASPIIPGSMQSAATALNIPLYSYRSLLLPDGDPTIWEMLQSPRNTIPNVVLVGGGATACEIGQSLARLGGNEWNITIVAPTLLPNDDATLQNAALQLLKEDGIHVLLGKRVEALSNSSSVAKLQLNDGTSVPVDAIIMCTGRSPGDSLKELNLDLAGIRWTSGEGVHVSDRTLRSTTAPHVYACGDCASVVNDRDRRAAHAGWTGFHAARNMAVPWILRAGSKSVHPIVPHVTYTDPQLASVGLSHSDCVKRYGSNGFMSVMVPEEGTDLADIEGLERLALGFVEIRATKIGGRILGLTACGPVAAELANEVGVAIQNNLSVLNVARSMHSYPSHGYLLHRIALSMAMGNIFGALDTVGPGGRLLGALSRLAWKSGQSISSVSWVKRRQHRRVCEWEYEGSLCSSVTNRGQIVSFLGMLHEMTQVGNSTGVISFLHSKEEERYCEWLRRRPN